jgi:NTE family protein
MFPAVRIGLVLGAGGSVGVAYHGAVLSSLQEATGWDPRTAAIMVGTSAGSITASILRAGVPAADLVRLTENLPLSPEGAQLAGGGRPHRPRPDWRHAAAFRPVADPHALLHAFLHPATHPRRGLVAAAMPSGGIPTDAISGGINATFGGRWPELPLWLCAVDLRSGHRVVFGRPGSPPAPVGSAVAASCAIPGYFRPVHIGGRRFVDGGVHSMVNLDLLAGEELDLVIVSSPLSHSARVPGLAADSLLRHSMRRQLRREVEALRSRGVTVVAVEPSGRVTAAMGLNPMEARRRVRVSHATRAAVHRWLREGIEGRHLARVLSVAARTAVTPVPDVRTAVTG